MLTPFVKSKGAPNTFALQKLRTEGGQCLLRGAQGWASARAGLG